MASNKILHVPFTIIIDTREELPYTFHSLRGDADQGKRPLDVSTVREGLRTGDYSVKGYEPLVTIERKSLADLYSTLGQERERFEEEHERMSRMEFAAVVVEASLEEVMHHPPSRSQLEPKTVYRTWLAWEQAYNIPWHFCSGRRFAEVHTFRILERFWKVKNGRTKGRAY